MRDSSATALQLSPVVVEFIGAPGSGKTTLAAAVTTELVASGVRVAARLELERIVRENFVGRSRISTSLAWLGYALSHPRWGVSAARWMLRRDGTRVAERIVRITHRLRALDLLAGCAVDAWVPDEWLLHEISLAMAGARRSGRAHGSRLLDSALRRISSRTVVVLCESEPAVAAQRVAARKSESDLDGQALEGLLPRIRELGEIAQLVRARAESHGLRTIVVPTAGDSSAPAMIANLIRATIVAGPGTAERPSAPRAPVYA